MKFSGSNVLITGASRGIGKALAKTLASFGLKVWINYRNGIDAAELVKEEIEKNGGSAAIIKADVTSEKEFNEAIKTIVDADGQLSYLVNNAGITKDRLSLRMSMEDFTSVITANLTSTFIGCKASLKVMRKEKFGSIVNISSIVGEMGNPGQVNYAASKGGVNAMTKSFAKEAASRGIRYNAVTPGFIQTQMTEELNSDIKEEYEKNIPLSRFGKASEVADAVAFLLSDHSSYITGEILKVNGGLYV